MIKKYFSFKGRIGRQEYMFLIVILVAGYYAFLKRAGRVTSSNYLLYEFR